MLELHDLLFFDIETEGDLALKALEPVFTAPANYKDPAKIDAYIEEKTREFWECQSALDVDYARVMLFSYAVGFEGKPSVLFASDPETEAALLQQAWDLILHSVHLVGYNIRGFDLPVLLRRAMRLGVPLGRVPDLSKYNRAIVDLMQLLYHDGYAPGIRYRGLKQVCALLGIENSLDLDGSMVGSMDPDTLWSYAANDVHLIQEVAKRTCGYYW